MGTAARELPAPHHPGMEYVPANYFELPDADEFARTFEGPDAADELDALERPFSPDYDRTRFGRPPTRDELIAPFRR